MWMINVSYPLKEEKHKWSIYVQFPNLKDFLDVDVIVDVLDALNGGGVVAAVAVLEEEE